MKKVYLFVLLFGISIVSVFSQNIFDMSGLNTKSISGTARYMGMAGSFGALGGDVSSIWDNPASLGIFRSNELNFSLNIQPTATTSLFKNNKSSENQTKTYVNNFTWVFNLPSGREMGYLSSNFSFGFHRLNSFNRIYNVGGQISRSLSDLIVNMTNGLTAGDLTFTDDYDPYSNADIGFLSVLGYQGYLIDPANPDDPDDIYWKSAMGGGTNKYNFKAQELGYIDSYKIAYSGNVNDAFYFGLGVSLENYYKERKTMYNENMSVQSFDLYNETFISGVGVNFDLGLIWRTTDYLRLGASIKTPTFYSMKVNQISNLHTISEADRSSIKQYNAESPEFQTLYKYHSPMEMQFSAGLIFGSRGVLNVDYGLSIGSMQKFIGYNDNVFSDSEFAIENKGVKDFARISTIFKIGGELNVSRRIRLRAGFAYIASPINRNATRDFPINTTRTDMEYTIDCDQYLGSCGIGFVFNNVFLDFAYIYNRHNQTFMPFEMYSNTESSLLATDRHNIVATLTWKY